MRLVGKRGLREGNMKKLLMIAASRTLAVLLTVVLVYSPLSPIVTFAEEFDRDRGDRGADTTPPVVASHENVSVEATSDAGAVAEYTLPAANDDINGNVADV